ncbi:MAG: hypothetical protein ACTHO8_06745 [Solirubrobacterales bacterium]
MGKLLGIAWAALALCLLAPAGAVAASGQITRSLATPDWSYASIAGSVTWTGCELEAPKKPPEPPREEGEEELPPVDKPPPYCGWTPFVTVGPGSQASECSLPGREQPRSLGSGVTLAWEGSERRSEETAAFDVSGVPLSGGVGQLVCLSILEGAANFPWHAERTIPLASAPLTAEPLQREPPVEPCTCPAPGPHHRHHVRNRHHRRIFVFQHRKVP